MPADTDSFDLLLVSDCDLAENAGNVPESCDLNQADQENQKNINPDS